MFFLRDIRKMRNMTMKELGEKVGVTESAIQQYETEKREPNFELLLKLSETLECSVADLFYGMKKEEPVLPWEPPDVIADLMNAWENVSDDDKAMLAFIASKYK